MAFKNPPVAGTELVRSAIRSRGYVAEASGWSVNRDGTAEFADVEVYTNPFGDGTITLSRVIGKAEWEFRSFIEAVLGSNYTSTVTRTAILDTTCSAPSVDLPEFTADFNVVWMVEIQIDARATGAGAGLVEAELDIDSVTQPGIAIGQYVSSNERSPLSFRWIVLKNATESFLAEIFVYHTGGVAYFIQSTNTKMFTSGIVQLVEVP